MYRISWKKLVCWASAFFMLLFFLYYAIYLSPDKHEVTKYARTKWSREFRKVGLDEVPVHAKYGGGWIDGIDGHWNFKADVPTMRQWISRSKSLQTTKVRTKPNKNAYIFYMPATRRACLVVVSFAPKLNPPLDDNVAWAIVNTIEVGIRKHCSSGTMEEVNDENEALKILADNYLDSNILWVDD